MPQIAFVSSGSNTLGYVESHTGDWYMKGKVSIGTTKTDHKLNVNGTIRATEVKVESGWADFVFAPEYKLRPLSEVEAHIQKHGRLPEVPSAQEVEKNGIDLGRTDALLLQKIEELTLYQIELLKRIEALEKQQSPRAKKGRRPGRTINRQ